MKFKEKLYSLALVSTAMILFLILISSTASAAPVQSASPTVQYAYVTNWNNIVFVIDTATNNVTATVPVGMNSTGVAVATDGSKVYVANSVSNTVSVISTSTNNVTATVDVGNGPAGVAVSPDGTKVYVTNDFDDNVSIIDTATNTVTATVNVGDNPQGVAVVPDGSKVYVANWYTNIVSVIDTATNAVAEVLVGSGPIGVAVSPDGTKVYVTNSGSKTVSVIDTATNTVTATTPVGNNPVGVSVTPDGTKVYVVNAGSSTVSVINTTTNNVTATVPVGSYPSGVAVNPDGTKVYVANWGSNSVSVINTTTNNVTATVPVDAPTGIAVGPALELSTITVGQNATTPDITQKFIEAYKNNGGILPGEIGPSALGDPTTEVHYAFGFQVQDFPDLPGVPGGVIMYNPIKNSAFYIHGAIWQKYRYLEAEDKDKLGSVASDEGEAAIQPGKTTGRYTKFETGTIHWISDKDGENVGHLQRGESFVTYGELDELYTEMKGTYSDLGFPIKDQITNTDGHDYCEFEGGNIYWDGNSYQVEYKNALPTIINTTFRPNPNGYQFENFDSWPSVLSWEMFHYRYGDLASGD
ncbi:MAG: beta-propeller fold lactonase family protein, partial [Methanosarcina sp.]|nr:beta-propeller fold lactonase family protein [Methanosarcina sp.]